MKITILFLLVACVAFSNPLDPIILTEQTLKLGTHEELYFGFAEGDEILLDLEVVQGKTIKELTIEEYPSTSRYNDIKITAITNKSIKVNKEGIYKFTFKPGGLGKIIRIKIQRIPVSLETKNFNTKIDWIEKVDTTYKVYTKKVIVGYDTTWVTQYRKVLTKSDSLIVIESTSARVHSKTNLSNPNYLTLTMTLPKNVRSHLESKEVVSWSYSIETGSVMAISQNLQKFSTGLIQTRSKEAMLIGAALGLANAVITPSGGENVIYNVTFYDGSNSTRISEGNDIAKLYPYKNQGTQGLVQFYLENDNLVNGIDVTVHLTSIIKQNIYIEEPYQQMVVDAIKEEKTFKDPIYTKHTVPVLAKQ